MFRPDRPKLLLRLVRRAALLAALGLAALVAASSVGAVTPGQQAKEKQRQAQAVLDQIGKIDMQVEHAAEQWNGAKLRLAGLQRQLAVSRRRLDIARRSFQVAVGRVQQRLVTLYTSGEPAPLDVLAGATSIGDLMDRYDAAKAIADQDARLARQTREARSVMQAREAHLRQVVAAQRQTVAVLAGRKALIEGRLAERKKLLSSIKFEIAVLQKQEAIRQAKLAAEARARLAHLRQLADERAAAARAAAQRAAAERAAAQRAAAAKAIAAHRTPTTSGQQPADPQAAQQPAAQSQPATQGQTTTTDPGTDPPAGGGAAVPSSGSDTSSPQALPAGHPEAASIGLNYLGIPYRWAGDNPTTGFDCSGFVAYVYAQIGIHLDHYTGSQWNAGVPVSRDQLQPGDLVFFYGEDHVGIYIGNNQFVHAPHTGDVVKISYLDGGYFGAYVGARRIP